jgi:hypothetical protein
VKRDPFFVGVFFGHAAFTVDAESRLENVKSFTAAECRAALKLTDLQKAVRLALERRLKRLKEAP